MPQKPSDKLLLVGGGVGTAPMLYLGEQLAKNGHKPTFLLGARSDKAVSYTHLQDAGTGRQLPGRSVL